MPLYTKTLRQCIVEFISDATIGGVYTDGVRNSTSTSGPWTWVVPAGVTIIKVDMIAGGCGGGAGWNTGAALAGGGGGTSGPSIQGMDVHVIPGASLTITAGAGGSGGVSGGAAANIGGRTTISGLTRPFWWRRATYASGVDGTIETGTPYGGNGGAATATTSGGGGSNGNNILGRSNAVTNGTTGLTATGYAWSNAPGDTTNVGASIMLYYGGRMWAQGAAAGGAAHTSPDTAGGDGGTLTVGGDNYNALYTESSVGFNKGVGDTTTTISRGGGGSGSHSFLAFGGKGGNGGVAGANGSFGSGGGGGGGGANGGSGGNGYVRILYWTTN